MTEEKGVKDYLKDISEAVKGNEVKRRKIPWRGRIGKMKVKKGWASILYVHNNRTVEFVRAPIEDNTVKVGDLYHTATPDEVLIYKNKPMILITEWSIKPIPFNVRKHYEKTEEEGELTTPQRHILSKLEQGILKPKKKFAMGGWIILILALLGVAYFISQGGLSGG